jgi:hypothetical protein
MDAKQPEEVFQENLGCSVIWVAAPGRKSSDVGCLKNQISPGVGERILVACPINAKKTARQQLRYLSFLECDPHGKLQLPST